MGHVGRTDAETFWSVYFMSAGVCQPLTRTVRPLFSSLQLQRSQGDRGLTRTQWKGPDTTWSANPQVLGSMLVSTIPNGLFQDKDKSFFFQQQPITVPQRAEGAVKVEMPTGPRATTSSHKSQLVKRRARLTENLSY
jgi:hypothetical protein